MIYLNYTAQDAIRETLHENALLVPKPRTNYDKRSFIYGGAMLWNEFRLNVRALCALKQSKRDIENRFSSLNRLLHGNLINQ